MIFDISTHLSESGLSEIRDHEFGSVLKVERFDPCSADEVTRTEWMRLDGIGHEGLVRDVHNGARTGECFVVQRMKFIEHRRCDVPVDDDECSRCHQCEKDEIVEAN